MEVNVSHLGVSGKIEYNEEEKTFSVAFEKEVPKGVIKRVKAHLSKEQEFKIPESQEIDDFRIDKVKPTENLTYFELALSTLSAGTDVFVHW